MRAMDADRNMRQGKPSRQYTDSVRICFWALVFAVVFCAGAIAEHVVQLIFQIK